MPDAEQDKLDRSWRDGANSEEEQRLGLLDTRIARRKRILADDIDERRKIMMSILRRQRRAAGKN